MDYNIVWIIGLVVVAIVALIVAGIINSRGNSRTRANPQQPNPANNPQRPNTGNNPPPTKPTWQKRLKAWWDHSWKGFVLFGAIMAFHGVIKILRPEITDRFFKDWTTVFGFYFAVLIGSLFIGIVPGHVAAKRLMVGIISLAFILILINMDPIKSKPGVTDDYAGAEVTVNDTGAGVRVISKSNPIENVTAGSVPDSVVTTKPRSKPVVSSVVAKASTPERPEDLSPLYAGGLPGTIPRNMNEWIEVSAPGNTDATRDPTTGYPTNCSEVISFDNIARKIRGDAWDVKKYRVIFKEAENNEMFRWIDANDSTNFIEMLPGHSSHMPHMVNEVKAASQTDQPCTAKVRLILKDEFKIPMK